MKFTSYLLIPLLLIISSCNGEEKKQKEEFDALFAEVMKIHDDVMPETNNLYKLKKFAQENIDVLPDTSSFVKQLRDVQVSTEKADDVMMEWMEDFSVPNTTHQEKMSYLKQELDAIEKVRSTMLSTLYEGKQVIRSSDKYIKKNKLRNEAKTNLYPK